MLHKYNKGEYGYLKAYRRGKLMISLILAIMISFIIITMLFLFGDTGRVMIVFAILLALPFAKFVTAWIMCAGFAPLKEEQYQTLCETIAEGDRPENTEGVLFDVVITQYEGMKFYPSMCIKNGKVIALVLSKDYQDNKKDYRTWIERCIADSKYKYSVTLCSDIREYGKKVRSVSTPNDKTRLIDGHIREKILTTCV